MNTTSPPPFVVTDQATVMSQLIATFEAALGKTLYLAQVERILLDIMAYREALLRLAIQSSAQENLVDFATGDRLEGLGRLVGVTRIQAEAALVTFLVSIPAVSVNPTPIYAGLRATDGNGLAWRTLTDLVIPAGELSGTVLARCETAGTSANGIGAGSLFTPLTGNTSIISITDTAGGTDTEKDPALRTRILAAPFGFSAAGPAAAYRYHTLSADASIVDAFVVNGGPGIVNVYPLTATGLPTQPLMDEVLAALSAETVRPLNDQVQVLSPIEVPYVIQANLVILTTAVAEQVMATAQAAIDAYVADRAAGLGRDLVGSQIIATLSVPGVYKVELVGWVDQVLDGTQWANGSANLVLAGTAEGR